MNITHPTRMIPAAALAVVLATSAQAYELFPLSAHDDWTVGVEVWDDGGMSCAAQTRSIDGMLDITMTDQGAVQVFILFDNPKGEGQILPADLVIAGVKRWQINGFLFTPVGASFEFVSQITALKFMLDIQQGAQVTLTQTDQDTAYGVWSLRGSRDAIDSLFECYRRISGVGA